MYVIRTSDRGTFKRCRRKWGWSSHLKQNRTSKEPATPLWLGTGIHYALEDYHGYNVWGHPASALKQYVEACKRVPNPQHLLPEGYQDATDLGVGMMDHYADQWLMSRDPLTTFVWNGVPQVEVTFEIPLPIDEYEVLYRGTIDRMVVDRDGRLWPLDYKSAKSFATMHYDTDPQVSSYCWAAEAIYGQSIAGMVYQQHKKTLPDEPRWLASGRFSVNKDQATTHRLYREGLLKVYGSTTKAPAENINFLNSLALREDENNDGFVRRDFIHRNKHQLQAEGTKILMEVEDMLNPDLPLYPNPTRDCSWDCNFQSACIAMDSGGDWEYILMEETTGRDEEDSQWRMHLSQP